jgi:hypothetical protein
MKSMPDQQAGEALSVSALFAGSGGFCGICLFHIVKRFSFNHFALTKFFG